MRTRSKDIVDTEEKVKFWGEWVDMDGNQSYIQLGDVIYFSTNTTVKKYFKGENPPSFDNMVYMGKTYCCVALCGADGIEYVFRPAHLNKYKSKKPRKIS